jgi:hypothetical protein
VAGYAASNGFLWQNNRFEGQKKPAAACRSVVCKEALSIPGSEVARRLKHDRSAVNRTAQRVDNDPELKMAATTIIEQFKRKIKQR